MTLKFVYLVSGFYLCLFYSVSFFFTFRLSPFFGKYSFLMHYYICISRFIYIYIHEWNIRKNLNPTPPHNLFSHATKISKNQNGQFYIPFFFSIDNNINNIQIKCNSSLEKRKNPLEQQFCKSKLHQNCTCLWFPLIANIKQSLPLTILTRTNVFLAICKRSSYRWENKNKIPKILLQNKT